MQTVFALQLPQYGHGTVVFVRVADLPTVLIDPQRYDMKMLTGDILMFENDIGLVAVTHALHVLAGDVPELLVGQFIFRRRIQRGMEDRVRSPAVGFEIRHEALHAGVDVETSVPIERFEHLLPEEHFCLAFIYLLLVVIQSPAGRGARPYIRNHSAARFARFRISILRAFSSRVRCSSAAI